MTPTERACAAMLGVALGDALGATVEFMTPAEIRAQYREHRNLTGGGWLRLKPGQITDDTGMMLALADAIHAGGGRTEPLACAQAFDRWMRNKPVDIGNTVRRGIVHFRRTGNAHVPLSDDAAGNGALMRCLPVALATYGTESTHVMAAWHAQAHVTHNNVISDLAGELFMNLLHAALSGADKRQLLHEVAHPFASRQPEFAFRSRRRDYPTGFVVETVQAVLQAFFDTDDFESCLIEVVNRGGDADTTGAIAGMLAGAHYGMAKLPERWLSQLDQEIRARCQQEGATLMGYADEYTERKIRAA